MPILFLTSMLPSMRSSGGEVVSQAVIDALRAADHEVTVVGYRRSGTDPPVHRDDLTAGDWHIETSGAGARPVLWMARALATGQPYTFAKFRSAKYLRAARIGVARGPDAIVIDHAATAWVLPRLNARGPYAYLAHNVEHTLHGSRRGPLAPIRSREARLLREAEIELATTASRVWALTEEDADCLKALGGDGRVVTISPPATQVDEFLSKVRAEADVRLLGTWTWAPNATGLRWFLSGVVPRLPPETTVEVAGKGADALCRGCPGVLAVGTVADASQFLRGARALAVPSLEGAGVQIKTLDAIATGLPVVATRTALRGIQAPPPSVSCAETPEGFAGALVTALRGGPRPDVREAALSWSRVRRRAFEAKVATEANQLGNAGDAR